jgi:hypothetical protein
MLGSGIVMHGQMRKGVAAGHLEALAHRFRKRTASLALGNGPHGLAVDLRLWRIQPFTPVR